MNEEKNDLENWNLVAEEYDKLNGKEGDFFRRDIIIPAILDLLGDIDGKKVFDAGCGNGCIANKLLEKGAFVEASDGSEKLIELAKKNFPQIGFTVQNLNEKIPFENDHFDAVLCSMVLNDLEDPSYCLSEFYRITKPDGKIIIVLPHPCFTYPVGVLKKGFWRRLLRKEAVMYITNYEKERLINVPIHGMKTATARHHRKIQTYFELFRDQGFTVKNIKEPGMHGEKNIENIPFIIIFELEKDVK